MSYPDKCVSRARARMTRRAPLFLIPSPPGSSRQVHPDVGTPTPPPIVQVLRRGRCFPPPRDRVQVQRRDPAGAVRASPPGDGRPLRAAEPVGHEPARTRAKHDTWLNLGKMESFEAMRLFVKLMDEERPRWWEVSPGGSGRTPTRRPSNPEPKIPELPSALAASTRGAWTRTPDAGTPPLPRYQHATVIVNHRVYIVGGSYRGRFIGDVHEFDLDTSSWRRVECVDARGAPAPLSPCAGHRLVAHRGAVYLVGGRFKGDEREKYLTLMRMDIVTGTDPRDGSGEPRRSVRWMPAETSGPKPSARRGHSATTVGDALVVFGGEDAHRTFLGDAHALDLKTMTWRAIEPGRDPGASQDPDATRPRRGRNTWRQRGATTRSSSSAERARVSNVSPAYTRSTFARGAGNGCDPRDLRPGRARATRRRRWTIGFGASSAAETTKTRARRMSPRSISTRWNGSTARRRRREVEAQRSPRRSSWARE